MGKERKWDEEENERRRDRERWLRAANPKSLFLRFCRTGTKQHLITSQTRVEDGSVVYSATCLTLVCEVIWYRLVQVRQNLKKEKWLEHQKVVQKSPCVLETFEITVFTVFQMHCVADTVIPVDQGQVQRQSVCFQLNVCVLTDIDAFLMKKRKERMKWTTYGSLLGQVSFL